VPPVAAVDLLRRGGADVIASAFVIDLPDLGGADRLRALDVPVTALVSFPGH
jgi:adenine phosphoribosyltransferase